MLAIRLFLGAYGAMLVIAFASLAFGQQNPPKSVEDYRLETLDKRITNIEALGIDHRLTVIETLLAAIDKATTWNIFSMGGTGVLLVEMAYRRATGKKPPSKPE